jgi:outer membrane beta-barrel protein
MKRLLATLTILTCFHVYAEDELGKKLEKLNIPDDKVSPVVSKDKLYVVNTRYSSLNKRHEVDIFGANNFTSDSHLLTRQAGMSYRFHINDKWGVGLRYTNYFNELSDAGKALFDNKSLLPDSDFAYKSTDLFVNYNTMYGKLRLSKESVIYFDQYISLGYGTVDLESGEQNMIIADLGFSFWLGQNYSIRAGLKNEFYEQRQKTENRNIHNAMGYISFGYLFGKGSTI